ncbi:type I glyceraldehyde-3-phosphate dehydrogenase [Aquibacillus sediminis]|uniref:type I glyceraldehyde-3-phosphate dehydrogenase n=1 Tax=Aquibacillus sediminis TaxID=2574734 RepID=UPI001108D4A4|nr:type I glyceraldehyde-3-phosphate dehydrogenase [Aquibacillus sediminis]
MERGIGISGTGRIGRLLIRKIISDKQGAESLKAINSTYPPETIAHLLIYDSVHGKWDVDITAKADELHINGNVIKVTCHRNPSDIPWKNLGVDLVIDATGKFKDRQSAGKHIEAGASKVLITAPGKQLDATIVMGVNEHFYQPDQDTFVSAASCTTNCAAPLLKVLDDAFEVERGWLTTVHSFTSDQKPLDNPHKDLRRARASTQSIIPTTTGVGKALTDVLPHLAPHMQGTSVRVPTPDVSLVDLTVQVGGTYTIEDVQDAFETAAVKDMAGIVGITDKELVSSDYIGCENSATVDGPSTMTMGNQIKVLAWYDNEWAYACRVAELANYMRERMLTNGKVKQSS